MEDKLTIEERSLLLKLARQAITEAVSGQKARPLELASMPPALQAPGVTFVTLTEGGNLRGCIGALEPYQSLAEDVREHAAAAALHDFRFPPVCQDELGSIQIEISRLTFPTPLEYNSPEDLVAKLRPGVDGVIIRDGMHRATFLPQVWQKLPVAQDFLDHLCQKMGAPPDRWRRKKISVEVYQVEEFQEESA
jgi:AmmeMemoRadiSam system protein A